MYLGPCQAVSLRSRPVYLGALSDDLDKVLMDLDDNTNRSVWTPRYIGISTLDTQCNQGVSGSYLLRPSLSPSSRTGMRKSLAAIPIAHGEFSTLVLPLVPGTSAKAR